MVNLVQILVYRVVMNGLMHVHNLEWIVGPGPLHNNSGVICQYTVFTPSLW